jgi:hypothetical protein
MSIINVHMEHSYSDILGVQSTTSYGVQITHIYEAFTLLYSFTSVWCMCAGVRHSTGNRSKIIPQLFVRRAPHHTTTNLPATPQRLSIEESSFPVSLFSTTRIEAGMSSLRPNVRECTRSATFQERHDSSCTTRCCWSVARC